MARGAWIAVEANPQAAVMTVKIIAVESIWFF